MNLKVTRLTKDSVTVDTTKFGTIIVFQQIGKKDNKFVTKVLKQYLDSTPANIYYEYKLVSVFIFDLGNKTLSKNELNELRSRLGGKMKYAVVQGGQTVKGSTLQQINVQCSKEHITVNQKFTMLLSVNRKATEAVSS